MSSQRKFVTRKKSDKEKAATKDAEKVGKILFLNQQTIATWTIRIIFF